jgi:Family of unknown function (DUF5317)
VLVLLAALVLGLAVGYARGGRLENIRHLELRCAWLILVALALQLVAFSPLGNRLGSAAVIALHLVSYAVLLAFGGLNLRSPGVVLAASGAALNGLAIAVNGGYMPATRSALSSAGRLYASDTANNSRIADAHTRLRFLCDVFAVPHDVPLANVFSLGDVCVTIGVAIVLGGAMNAQPKREQGSEARPHPAGEPARRR